MWQIPRNPLPNIDDDRPGLAEFRAASVAAEQYAANAACEHRIEIVWAPEYGLDFDARCSICRVKFGGTGFTLSNAPFVLHGLWRALILAEDRARV